MAPVVDQDGVERLAGKKAVVYPVADEQAVLRAHGYPTRAGLSARLRAVATLVQLGRQKSVSTEAIYRVPASKTVPQGLSPCTPSM